MNLARPVVALAATAAARAPVTSAAPSRGLEVRFLVTAAQAESLVPGNLRRTLAQLRPHARGAVRGVRGDVAKTAALRDLVRRSIAPGATGCYGYATILNALGGAGAFAVFGVIAILAFFFVVWLAPETKGRPLEDIGRYWENGGRW